MLNCPLVLGDMTDSPSGPWICSIVSSATPSDADSASAYFSSSDFFELIVRIVLWWHAMCSVLHAFCCRQGGGDPIWWCSNTLEETRAYNSQHTFREDHVFCLHRIALIRRIHCLKHWLRLMDVDVRAGPSQELRNSKAHTSIMPRGAFSISMDPADAILEFYQMVAMALWLCCNSGCTTGVTHFVFKVEGDHFFLMPYLTLRFWHQGSWVLSPKNYAGVFVFGSLPLERRLRIWILLSGGRRHNCGRGLKHTPLATFEYAWLHRR